MQECCLDLTCSTMSAWKEEVARVALLARSSNMFWGGFPVPALIGLDSALQCSMSSSRAAMGTRLPVEPPKLTRARMRRRCRGK